MGVTSVDLYRSGNSTNARLDKIRPNDIETYADTAGQIWVRANGKGVSTASSVDPTWSGKPWKLQQGHTYSSLLIVWEDIPGHWSWAPAHDMLKSDYEATLAQSNGHFV